MTKIEPYFDDGKIKLFHGDCQSVVDNLGTFDVVLTDPPYGINAGQMTMGAGQSSRPKSERFKKKAWDSNRPHMAWVLEFAPCVCVWGGNFFPELGVSKHWWAWDKKNDGRSFGELELAWTNIPTNTRLFRWYHSHNVEPKQHPTQKPLSLFRWCLGMAPPDAQTVLDPFAGSGTTLVAAKLDGLSAVGIEIDEQYCEIAARRLEQGALFA